MPLSIVSDDNDSITIRYNGNEYTISKKGEFDPTTRYIHLGDTYYEDIGFEVTDGYAICNGNYSESRMVDAVYGKFGALSNEKGGQNDVIEARFPKMREILTNEELIEECLSYFAEQYDGSEGNNILETYLKSYWHHNVVHFFEGLFFFGGHIQFRINGK
jgi:hypothetical protein